MLHRMQRKDERGAVLVLSAVGLVMALIFTGMAVDLGFIAQRARQDQKVADLVALDAVRMLPSDPTAAAQASATRNNFAYGTTGYSLVVEWGPSKTGPFSSIAGNLPSATAVRITATSPHKNMLPFLNGPASVVRKAVATKKDIAGFTLGSSLANVNTSTSPLLNAIVGPMIGGALNLSLASWQGLAAGKLTLSALQTELIKENFTVGSVSQLLNTDLTAAQFFHATAEALRTNGDTANASILDALVLKATSTATFKLNKMIVVEQGTEGSAANAELDLLHLVTGSASLANGSNLISIPNIGITIPNAGAVAVSLSVIEAAKTYIGTAGVGPHVTTGQIALTVTPTVNLLNLLGLVKVTGSFPVEFHAAGATGTLKSIACPSKNIVVTVDPTAVSGAVKSSTLDVSAAILGHLLDVNQTNSISAAAAVDAPAQDVPFTYSSEFSPPNSFSKHIGSQPIGLKTPNVITGTTANVNLAGLVTLGLNANTVLSSVLSALDTMVGDIDSLVLTPLLQTLGLDIGGADVTALGIDPVTGVGLPQCGLPALAG